MTLDDLQAQREGSDFEAKAAQGQDGHGALPQDIWASYSAFANTNGGVIALGVRENKDKSLRVVGIANADKVYRELWNGLNNRKTVSVNLLTNESVTTESIGGYDIVLIRVPKASRQQRPVYVGENPMKGTYMRQHEGDYHCPEQKVRQLIAEAEHDTRDARPLPHYGLADLDVDSLAAYRNQFRSTRPAHPWLSLSDQDLLHKLGGWYINRENGDQGLTIAGLLMFGQQTAIESVLSEYLVDYQEKAPSQPRWLDRITTDGTWSGNLYDFYRRVYPKLVSDLKVPFQLRDQHQRIDETPVHVALREALVNALIHADYSGSTGILITKEPDKFLFRNPGSLRIPVQEVYRGGNSDCRNRNLQKMFQMIGEGEKAGSGFPTILQAWESQSWSNPKLLENQTPEYVLLQLTMASWLPQEIIDRLTERFGTEFTQLDENERLALALADFQGYVTNEEISKFSYLHSADLTKLLRGLVRGRFLVQELGGRWTKYRLVPQQQPIQVPATVRYQQLDLPLVAANSHDSSANSHDSADSSHDSPADSHDSPITVTTWESLLTMAEPSRLRRLKAPLLTQLILQLTTEAELTVQQLSVLLGRTPNVLRSGYLSNLVKNGQLLLRYPTVANHPRQAYRAA